MAAGTLVVAAGAVLTNSLPVSAQTYRVRPGDSLWSISRRTGAGVDQLMRDNHLRDGNRIYVGQALTVPDTRGGLTRQQARAILTTAARRHGLRPSFVLAVAWWESGWNPDTVSSAGAIGMMQVTPGTAAFAGPALLGRAVDLRNPRDNADLGAALLRRYVDEFNDPKLALAAYYQGEAGTRKDGIYPGSHGYVDGIWALRNRFEQGQLP